jgi:hypothetical protein
MEADIMKKYVISGIVALAVFTWILSASGQPAGESQQTEQIEQMQLKWQNLSEQEKDKLRAKIQDRTLTRGSGLEGQLEAVKKIEQQVIKLKSAIESMIQSRNQYQNASEQDKVLFSKKIAQATQTRQQAVTAIEKELEGLRYQRPRQQPSGSQMNIRELQMIYRLALKEKATETAKSLESLIAGTQKEESQTQSMEQGLRKEPEIQKNK